MADMLFLKRSDGTIVRLEGDDIIHNFVELTRGGYDHIQVIGDIYKRVSLIEHDPCVRDRIMARLFLFPRFPDVFEWLIKIKDEKFAIAMREFKDCLSYTLFPTSMEYDRQLDRKFGRGGALMRSLGHIPVDTLTYFQ